MVLLAADVDLERGVLELELRQWIRRAERRDDDDDDDDA
jgi:hypothetical protein